MSDGQVYRITQRIRLGYRFCVAVKDKAAVSRHGEGPSELHMFGGHDIRINRYRPLDTGVVLTRRKIIHKITMLGSTYQVQYLLYNVGTVGEGTEPEDLAYIETDQYRDI